MTYGLFKADTAKLVLETVRYLRQNGFVLDPSRSNTAILRETPIYVRNDSGLAIPPFACMQTTGTVEAGGQNYITVDQPADVTGDAGGYLFNGIAEIEIGGYGIAHDGPVVRMAHDGSVINNGDALSPVVNDWEVTKTACGPFKAIGGDDIGTNVVRAFAYHMQILD